MKFQDAKPTARDLLVTIDDIKGGINSLINEAKMPSKFAVQSNNLIQVQNGVWKTRWGTQVYGA